MDIEGFSHLYVLWIFDRSVDYDLLARPPLDDRPHGVFATRSPRRPNPIGLTVVRLLGREGAHLRVRGVDMLDGTPIVDLKPYLSSVAPEELRRGWLTEAEARAGASGLPVAGRPANSIVAIRPYKIEGLWVFDDPSVGLRQEPFVSGADTIIDRMVESIPDAESGFTLMFAAEPFPGFQAELEWRRAELSGNWYSCAALEMEGWLCPALLKYFPAPPPKLYAAFRPAGHPGEGAGGTSA